MLTLRDKLVYNRTTTNSSSYMLSSAGTIVIAFAMTIWAVLTVVGNICVIIAFKRTRRLRILSYYFLVSLAVTDMTIGLVSIPLYSVYTLIGYWPFGAVVCDIWLCLDYTLSNASMAHLLVICFDRYVGVFMPTVHRTKRSLRKICITIAIIWIVSFLLCSPWIISWPYIEGRRTVPATECYIPFLQSSPFVTIVLSLLVFYIPMLIIIMLYVCIYRKALILLQKKGLANTVENEFRSSNENITCHKQVCTGCFAKCAISMCCMRVFYVDNDILNDANTQRCFVELTTVSEKVMLSEAHEVTRTSAFAADITTTIMDNQIHKTNLDDHANTLGKDRPNYDQICKVTKVLSAILIAHLALLLPFYVFAVLNPLCSTCVNDTAWHIAWGLCYINSTANPFLYALCNVNFRRAFYNILTGCCRQLQ